MMYFVKNLLGAIEVVQVSFITIKASTSHTDVYRHLRMNFEVKFLKRSFILEIWVASKYAFNPLMPGGNKKVTHT